MKLVQIIIVGDSSRKAANSSQLLMRIQNNGLAITFRIVKRQKDDFIHKNGVNEWAHYILSLTILEYNCGLIMLWFTLKWSKAGQGGYHHDSTTKQAGKSQKNMQKAYEITQPFISKHSADYLKDRRIAEQYIKGKWIFLWQSLPQEWPFAHKISNLPHRHWFLDFRALFDSIATKKLMGKITLQD